MSWWMWAVLGLVLLLFEVFSGGFYLLFFGVSGIAVGFLTKADWSGPQWFQWVLFALLSIVGVLYFRRPLLARFKLKPIEYQKDLDSLIGETAFPTGPIPVNDVGKVELRGTSWSARNAGAAPLAAGQRCRVERVEGLTLFIRGD